MNAREALMRLGASTAEAIAKALENLCPGQVERGDVSVLSRDTSPFETLETPAVAVSVAYVDGVTGGNVFLMTTAGARRLAASMNGAPAPSEPDAAREEPAGEDAGGEPAGAEQAGELTELELSAVAEAANLMMAAAAAAIGVVLGEEIEIAPPQTRLFASQAEAAEAYEIAPHATRATFRVCDEPCRLVQLVPNAFVVRMTRALDELGVEHVGGSGGDGDDGEQHLSLDEALRDIRVRVWAELGRTRVPLGRAPDMPAGTVLELDRKAEDPVDLYVNGLRFASGTLVLAEDGEWALRLAEVSGREAAAATATPTPEHEGTVA